MEKKMHQYLPLSTVYLPLPHVREKEERHDEYENGTLASPQMCMMQKNFVLSRYCFKLTPT